MTRTMLSSARPPRVYEQIVADIERAIYEGRLRRGDKLPAERSLVRQFGASRVAVREALRTLEHRGLAEVRQGSAGGHFIRDVDSAPLLRDLHTLLRLGRVSLPQLMEARLLVEPETARLAAERASEADVKAMTAVLEERGGRARPGSLARTLDLDFHRLVAGAARNPIHAALAHTLMELEARVVPTRLELSARDRAEVGGAHARILAAIVGHQPALARAEMEAHLEDVHARLGRRLAARAVS